MAELFLKFNVDELREKLEENREKHADTHAQAVEGYRAAVADELRGKLEKIEAGKQIDRSLTNVYPEHHLDEYDEVLNMLALTSDSQIELAQHQFRQFVRDEWNWKQQFTASTSSYL